MLKRALKLLLPIIIVGAAVLIAMAMVRSRPELQTADAVALLPRVKVVDVSLGDVPITIVAHGTVSARHELDLASEVTGRVIWMAPEFEPGQKVSAGQVLFRVDPVA